MLSLLLSFALAGAFESRVADIEANLDIQDKKSSALVISKDMTIPSDASFNSVVVMKGNLELYGKIENLVIVNGHVHLHKGAEVTDQLVVIEGSVQQDEGAIVPLGSPLKRTWSEKWRDAKENFRRQFDSGWLNLGWIQERLDRLASVFWMPLAVALPLAVIVVLFGISLVFLLLAPRISQFADESFQNHPLASLTWGACAYLLFLPTLGLMTISLVGIPLIPIFILFAVLILFAGFFSVSRTTGHFILKKFGQPKTIFSTFLGIAVIFSLFFMPVFGHSLVFLSIVAGTGAMLRSLFHKDSHQRPSYMDE
jgi:hypothetical protein